MERKKANKNKSEYDEVEKDTLQDPLLRFFPDSTISDDSISSIKDNLKDNLESSNLELSTENNLTNDYLLQDPAKFRLKFYRKRVTKVDKSPANIKVAGIGKRRSTTFKIYKPITITMDAVSIPDRFIIRSKGRAIYNRTIGTNIGIAHKL